MGGICGAFAYGLQYGESANTTTFRPFRNPIGE